MKKKILLTLSLIFISGLLYAKGKFESFVLEHPGYFFFLLLGSFLLLAGILLSSHYFMGKLGKRRESRSPLGEIPSGKVENVNLPEATLYHLLKKGEMKKYRIYPEREFYIGRSPTLCDVVLDNPKISWQHAKIRPETEGYILYDLASETGVSVNGRRIFRYPLKNADRIRIGKDIFLFELGEKRREERRRHQRVRLPLRFVVYPTKTFEKEYFSHTLDISEGGLKMMVEKFIPPESILELEIELPGKSKLEVMGRICWIKQPSPKKREYLVGLRFMEMDMESLRRLREVLYPETKDGN